MSHSVLLPPSPTSSVYSIPPFTTLTPTHSNQYHHSTNNPIFSHTFTAGAISLSLAYGIMHPLDTLKTLIQSSNLHHQSIILSWKHTLTKLTRGFMTSTLGAGIQGGLRFSSYEATKHILDTNHHSSYSSILSTPIAALIGDLTSSIIKVPREVITVRMQTHYYRNHHNPPITGLQYMSRIIRDEGPLALWHGFTPIIARDGPFMVVLFVTYELFKSNYYSYSSPNINHINHISTPLSIMFGGTSGAIAGFLTTPMDVLRTNVLTTTTTTTTTFNNKSSGIIHGLSNIYRSGGISSLYRGAIPRSAWWFGICAIFFPTYETIISQLQ